MRLKNKLFKKTYIESQVTDSSHSYPQFYPQFLWIGFACF